MPLFFFLFLEVGIVILAPYAGVKSCKGKEGSVG